MPGLLFWEATLRTESLAILERHSPCGLSVASYCTDSIAPRLEIKVATPKANEKVERLRKAGFVLSANDRRIVRYGQLLATLRSPAEVDGISEQPSEELASQP
jgi:hypothetical protein